MKTTRKQFLVAAALVGALAFITTQAGAQTEPLGGQSAPGARQSVPDLEAQVAYQRARQCGPPSNRQESDTPVGHAGFTKGFTRAPVRRVEHDSFTFGRAENVAMLL
jgi:hypothetical protein